MSTIIGRVFAPRKGPALGLVWALALITSGPAAGAQAPRSASADLVLYHGRIFTADSTQPWVDAVAIRGERIVGRGTRRELQHLIDAHTRLVDLGGRMAMPGINDVHDHTGGAPYGTTARTTTPAMDDPPLAEIEAAIAQVARRAPAGTWIRAEVGPRAINQPREARAMLERAAAGHPAILAAWWGHGVILNGAGLAALQLDDRVVDPPGGHYDRDEAGHLTGLAEEYAGGGIKRRLSTMGGVTAMIAPLQEYARQRLAEGVTSVQIMSTEASIDEYRELLRRAALPQRIRLMRFRLPELDGLLADTAGFGAEIIGPRARIDGIKWVLDGTPIEQLAYQSREYPGRPGWRGRPNFSSEFVERELRRALAGRDPLLLHIVGDQMTADVLDAMERLAPPARWRALRVRFEHADGFKDPALAHRGGALGIVVGQPRPGMPFRALVDAGLTLAYGSDAGMPPFFMLAQMTAPGRASALTLDEGLTVLTRNGAIAEGVEREKGMIAAGMLADLVVLSQDVTRIPPARIPATRSVMTMVGGRVVAGWMGVR